MRVTILGAGNWGTTAALLLHRLGHGVTLWEYDRDQAERVAHERRNQRFLPGYTIPNEIAVTWELESSLRECDVCLLAVPAQRCREVFRRIGALAADAILVSLVKGIEQGTLRRISEICSEQLRGFRDEQFAVLSGPTIATEVAAGLPTSAVVASTCHVTARRIQQQFSSAQLRLYTSDDVVGVELAGALKNVIALAAGIADGMSLGDNTKGTLVTRGLAEMTRLGEALGGKRQTLSGLSGMGDLVTTCTSPHSRNRTTGERIGRGEKLRDLLDQMVMVAEGVWTARAARDLARSKSIELPITEAVCRVLYDGVDPRESVIELMQRNLKAED